MNQSWYSKKWITILIHAAAWILLFSLPELLHPSYNPQESKTAEANATTMFIIARVSDALLITFFYLNATILIPALMYKKRYALYVLSLLLCLTIFTSATWLMKVYYQPQNQLSPFKVHILFSTFAIMFILACSIAYTTIKDKINADRLVAEKENENLKTELSLLRSQVSPHFMFNVLNNMVALARKHSEQLEPSLIKLSSLMRYMLYETDEEKVSLDKETDYLQSYIDLQQQRFGKKVAICVSMLKPDKTYAIEPMLLIPFVENAFKHGTGIIENACIDIKLHAANRVLYFTVQNKYNPASTEIKDKASGIGLSNVQRRLQLLYPGKHDLSISKENEMFKVSLSIKLI